VDSLISRISFEERSEVIRAAMHALIEIYRDNAELCESAKTHELVDIFINALCEKGNYPVFLRFLQVLLAPNGKPNQPLQLKVLISLPENQVNMMSLETLENYVGLLDAQDERQQALEELRYHIRFRR
jgi:hypothetical protein